MIAPREVLPESFKGRMKVWLRPACALPWLLAAAAAQAQGYPVRPVDLIIPWAAGSSTDVVYRVLTPALSARLGQPVVVVNRAGAASAIGMNLVARAPPDGYTLGVATLSFTANPGFKPGTVPYDTEKDFAPVSQVTRVPLVLEVHPSLPARSIRELIALARAKPGSIDYGSSGVASSGHLASALFASMTGIKMTHIPYSSTSSVGALVAGQFHLLTGPVPTSIPFIKAGKLIPLGVTSLKPLPGLPGVPTIAESGVPGFEVYEWSGVMAPAGTPAGVVGRLHQEIVRTLGVAEVRQRVTELGAEVVGSSPEELGRYVRRELATWAKVAAEIGPDDTPPR